MSSKPGAVGQNMRGALKGETPGTISGRYQGPPRNAIPDKNPCPRDPKPVQKWTQDYMQGRRAEERAKRQGS